MKLNLGRNRKKSRISKNVITITNDITFAFFIPRLPPPIELISLTINIQLKKSNMFHHVYHNFESKVLSQHGMFRSHMMVGKNQLLLFYHKSILTFYPTRYYLFRFGLQQFSNFRMNIS